MARPHDRWSQEHIDQMAALQKEGKTTREIATTLGVTIERVKSRIRWQTMPEWQLQDRREAIRRRRTNKYQRSKYEPSGRPQISSGPAIPNETVQERTIRYAAPMRDLTALYMGDPPVGYSALERRA